MYVCRTFPALSSFHRTLSEHHSKSCIGQEEYLQSSLSLQSSHLCQALPDQMNETLDHLTCWTVWRPCRRNSSRFFERSLLRASVDPRWEEMLSLMFEYSQAVYQPLHISDQLCGSSGAKCLTSGCLVWRRLCTSYSIHILYCHRRSSQQAESYFKVFGSWFCLWCCPPVSSRWSSTSVVLPFLQLNGCLRHRQSLQSVVSLWPNYRYLCHYLQ